MLYRRDNAIAADLAGSFVLLCFSVFAVDGRFLPFSLRIAGSLASLATQSPFLAPSLPLFVSASVPVLLLPLPQFRSGLLWDLLAAIDAFYWLVHRLLLVAHSVFYPCPLFSAIGPVTPNLDAPLV